MLSVCVLSVVYDLLSADRHAVVTWYVHGVIQLSQFELAIRRRAAEGCYALRQCHRTVI